MWDRWQKGDSLQSIAQLFGRNHSSVAGVFAKTGGIRPPTRKRRANALSLSEREEISRGATLVECQTRYVMLAKVNGKETKTVIDALIKQARKLPKELYKSLTWDRGKEVADHKRFSLAIDVYFCDPQSPWQRGRTKHQWSASSVPPKRNRPIDALSSEA